MHLTTVPTTNNLDGWMDGWMDGNGRDWPWVYSASVKRQVATRSEPIKKKCQSRVKRTRSIKGLSPDQSSDLRVTDAEHPIRCSLKQ